MANLNKPVDEEWDLFISHASEDKSEFVEPLASALTSFGVRVWYDRFTLKLGDSLSRSIDDGLAKSDYGLVVLSPAFIAKGWPEYELRGLTAREISGNKIILPIWHNISRNDVLSFSPSLADKLAINSSNSTPVQIAAEIIKVVRPEIFTRITRRVAWYSAVDRAEISPIPLTKLRIAPIQHETLPPALVGRIRLVRASLLHVHPLSMEAWIDGFRRDTHPTKEVELWEHMAAVHAEYLAMFPDLSDEQAERVFQIILSFSLTGDETDLRTLSEILPKDALNTLTVMYASPIPITDIQDNNPFAESVGSTEGTQEERQPYDKEHFLEDPPDELVRELMREQMSKPQQ